MVAKGFRGNYFQLAAITATVSQVKLAATFQAFKKKSRFLLFEAKKDESPPDDLLSHSKPCYCNIFFACLAHKVLKLSKRKKPPICRCRKTKSGIAPPAKLLNHL